MTTKEDWPRPYHGPTFRANFDRIFPRTDPAHSRVFGAYREYVSRCCGAEVVRRGIHGDAWCQQCVMTCETRLEVSEKGVTP